MVKNNNRKKGKRKTRKIREFSGENGMTDRARNANMSVSFNRVPPSKEFKINSQLFIDRVSIFEDIRRYESENRLDTFHISFLIFD